MSTTAATLKEKAPNNLLINARLALVEKGGGKRATSGPHHVCGDILLYLHSD